MKRCSRQGTPTAAMLLFLLGCGSRADDPTAGGAGQGGAAGQGGQAGGGGESGAGKGGAAGGAGAASPAAGDACIPDKQVETCGTSLACTYVSSLDPTHGVCTAKCGSDPECTSLNSALACHVFNDGIGRCLPRCSSSVTCAKYGPRWSCSSPAAAAQVCLPWPCAVDGQCLSNSCNPGGWCDP